MSIKTEIEKYSDPIEKEDLLLVFNKFHWASEWRILANCKYITIGPKSYEYIYKKWSLTYIGKAVAEKIKRES